jgi:hypothetical protein
MSNETVTTAVSADEKKVLPKPLIEWMREAFGLDFKSVHQFIKSKLVKVNDVLIRNASYPVKEGDTVTVNQKNFTVLFTPRKKK